MAGRLLNFAAFQIGWFACVLGAAHGRPWVGPVATAAIIAIHLARSARPAAEATLIAASGLVGFVTDTLLIALGAFSFPHASPHAWLPPFWLTCMWMIFATTLNSSLSWLSGRFALGALLGAIAGPASYAAGAGMGAATLGSNAKLGLGLVAGAWTLAMPLLLLLARRLSGRAGS